MHRLFLTLICGILPLTAFAQEGASAKRTCRILFLNGPNDAPKEAYLFDGTSSQKVKLPRMNLSPVYEIAPGIVTLRLLPAPVANTMEMTINTPSVSLPESATNIYLIVTSDKDQPAEPLRMEVIDASTDDFKPGQMLWTNLTENQVTGILGSEKLSLEPNGRKKLDAPAQGNESYPVKIGYSTYEDDRIRPICHTTWTHDPRTRSLMFISDQGGGSAPRIFGFTDYRPPGEDE